MAVTQAEFVGKLRGENGGPRKGGDK